MTDYTQKANRDIERELLEVCITREKAIALLDACDTLQVQLEEARAKNWLFDNWRAEIEAGRQISLVNCGHQHVFIDINGKTCPYCEVIKRERVYEELEKESAKDKRVLIQAMMDNDRLWRNRMGGFEL